MTNSIFNLLLLKSNKEQQINFMILHRNTRRIKTQSPKITLAPTTLAYDV